MWFPISLLYKAEREMYEQESYYNSLPEDSEERKAYEQSYRDILFAIKTLEHIKKVLLKTKTPVPRKWRRKY